MGITRRVAGRAPVLGRVLAERDRARARAHRLERRLAELEAERDGLTDERARLADLAARSRPGDEPSFWAHLEATRRVRELAESRHGVRHPVWRHNDKASGAVLARRVGVAVPERIAEATDLDGMAEPAVDAFVVKPVHGASARGVEALTRDDGRYRSLFGDPPRTWDEVVAGLRAEVEAGRVSPPFVVEELLAGPLEDEPGRAGVEQPGQGGASRSTRPAGRLPFDWKCYCLGGRVEVVMQKDPRGSREPRDARFRFWSREFEDLGPVRHADRYDPSLPPPTHPEKLVAAAERIAAEIPSVFVRVDLFDTPAGVRFGEITPHPGGRQRFTDDLDRELGHRWELAEARELAERFGDVPR